jgi:DnaK suppressor protein
MDDERARQLLSAERARVERALKGSTSAGEDDRAGADEPGDMTDPAPSLTEEQEDDAITTGLRARLVEIDRAEARLRAGTYGRSTKSGRTIPDERLEADPAAELTVDEAAADSDAAEEAAADEL